MDARAYTDTELERLFPEHPWREPVPLRFKDRRHQGGYGCRFCLYRKGLLPPLGLQPFASPEAVAGHVKMWHA